MTTIGSQPQGGPRGKRTRGRGFTLIELMITVAVIGILAAIAFPSYQSYIRKANRAAAQSFLMDTAQRQQHFLLDNRRYANALGELGMTLPDDVSPHYTITITNVQATPPTFTLTAQAKGSVQTSDGNLTLNHAGAKTPADKW